METAEEVIWKLPPIVCKFSKPEKDVKEFKDVEEEVNIKEEVDEVIWKSPPIDFRLSNPEKDVSELKE